ncbi:MAG: hypothetical protein LBT59_26730 [Clostridiales bacterium]|jgi:hypothetical protein|nr:hypothetical protein [Clostridiales bacterium]
MLKKYPNIEMISPKAAALNADASATVIEDERNFLDNLLNRFVFLSDRAKVTVVNSLFDYSFPPESKVSCQLPNSAVFADLVIKIDNCCFKAQLELGTEQSLISNVFKSTIDSETMTVEENGHKTTFHYPEVAVISLCPSNSSYTFTITHDEVAMEIKVPVVRPTEMTVDELVDSGLTFLLPLHMTKFSPFTEILDRINVPNDELQKLILVEMAEAIKGIEKGHSLAQLNGNDKLFVLSMFSEVCKHFYPGFELVEKFCDDLKEKSGMTTQENESVFDTLISFHDMAENANKRTESAEQVAAEAKKVATEAKKVATEAMKVATEAMKEIAEVKQDFAKLIEAIKFHIPNFVFNPKSLESVNTPPSQ